jgi:foldase protein PrsA
VRRPLVLPITAMILLTSCGNLFTTAAAVVNGRRIDEDRFVRELDFLLADPRFAEQLPSGEAGELRRKDLARQYLTFLIHQQFVEAFADGRDIEVDESTVDGLLEQQITELGGRASFDRILRQAGASEDDVRHLLEQQVLRQQVADAVVAEQVSDESLRQAYEDRILEFTEVHVAHILVDTEREAERIRQQATPKTFAALARRFSKDPASAPNGGDLGPQLASDLVSPFARATLRIPVGEIGGPVQTEFGFHVIHVIDRTTQPFAEVRDRLVEELRGQVFADWLVERVRSADIRVNPRYGYFDDGTGAVAPRTRSSPVPAPSVQLEP